MLYYSEKDFIKIEQETLFNSVIASMKFAVLLFCFRQRCITVSRRIFIVKSSRRRCSLRKDVLRNFAKFTGAHLCQSLFCDKVAGLKPEDCNFMKKEIWHRCFAVNFAKFIRKPFSQNTSGRLLLY